MRLFFISSVTVHTQNIHNPLTLFVRWAAKKIRNLISSASKLTKITLAPEIEKVNKISKALKLNDQLGVF